MREPDIEATVDRFARRYADRRFIMGTALYPQPEGMLRDYLRLDIALRRTWHALRPSVYGMVEFVGRLVRKSP